MPGPLLSILVPTLACRDSLFQRLYECLRPQMDTEIVLLKLRDDGQETTGAKRHRLIHAAETPYVAFVDDDDLLSPDYGRLVIAALQHKPDVVGFRLLQFDDGMLSANTIHSVACGNWRTEQKPGDPLPVHYRTPNHLNPIRRELALSIGYRDQNSGEDSDYSERLFARYPNMKEVFIDADLYLYHRRTNRIGERCNPNP